MFETKVKVKVGAYVEPERDLGAYLRDIGSLSLWWEGAHYPGTQGQSDNRFTTVYLSRQRGHNFSLNVAYLLTAHC